MHGTLVFGTQSPTWQVLWQTVDQSEALVESSASASVSLGGVAIIDRDGLLNHHWNPPPLVTSLHDKPIGEHGSHAPKELFAFSV